MEKAAQDIKKAAADIKQAATELLDGFKKTVSNTPQFTLYATIDFEYSRENDIHHVLITFDGCNGEELSFLASKLLQYSPGKVDYWEVFIEYFDPKTEEWKEYRFEEAEEE
ncbi:MAG: hypothetical protein HY929_00590 [Euryarchaeota archaeon]|nr:hypothetical protein [Euryarchaeota archaeon]